MSGFQLCMGIYGIQMFYGGDPRSIAPVVQEAEQAGFDQIAITDHVVMGEQLDRYPYGNFPTPPDAPWYEPIVTLSVLAAQTQRISLSQSILISPLRSAVLLAKQAATLDVLSGGRVVLGLGTGWQPEEYQASGLPFKGRKKVMFEQIAAMKALWRDAPAEFHGETLDFEKIYCRPAPAQGDIPCWVGVRATESNCRRIAETADGWIPIEQDPDEYAPGIARLRQAFEAAGRDPESLSVQANVKPQMDAAGNMDLDATLATIPRMLEAGVTHVGILPAVFVRESGQMSDFIQRCAAAKQRYGS